MFVMDVPPDVPPQYAPVVIAQSTQKETMLPSGEKIDRTIGVCHLASNNPDGSAVNSLSPLLGVRNYFLYTEKQELGVEGKLTVLKEPEHGRLLVGSNGNAFYRSNDTNFVGADRATLLVEIGGKRVKVEYFFKIDAGGGIGGTEGYDPYDDKENCPNGRDWKISGNDSDPKTPIYTFISQVGLNGVKPKNFLRI